MGLCVICTKLSTIIVPFQVEGSHTFLTNNTIDSCAYSSIVWLRSPISIREGLQLCDCTQEIITVSETLLVHLFLLFLAQCDD